MGGGTESEREREKRRASPVNSPGARWCGRKGPGRTVAAAMVVGAAAGGGEGGCNSADPVPPDQQCLAKKKEEVEEELVTASVSLGAAGVGR